MKKTFLTIAIAVIFRFSYAQSPLYTTAGYGANYSTDGAYVAWNISGGGGETNFVNNIGGGWMGGFTFDNTTRSNVTTRLMTILGSGNVGIGTTSPYSQLTLNKNMAGGLGSTLFLTNQAAPMVGSRTRLGFDLVGFDDGNPTAAVDGYLANTNGATDLVFNAYDGSNSLANYERVRIMGSTGYVGIGTPNPSNNLQIGSQTGAQIANPLTLSLGGTYSNAAGQNPKLKLYDDGASPYGFGISNGQLDAIVPTGANYAWYIAGSQKMILNNGGNVGIGTANPDQKLTVKGTIHSQEVIVDMSVLPDYVFKPAYHLPTLTEIKNYIDQNHHLPEMPSAEEVAKDGLSLGDMNAKLLKKVEELTLYLIEKDKMDKGKEVRLSLQQKQLIGQQKQINQLNQKLNIIIRAQNKK